MIFAVAWSSDIGLWVNNETNFNAHWSTVTAPSSRIMKHDTCHL